jgi:NAD(P)-dependent dehydrogenase (short-subunit alcohol dehydrogenase family)
VVLGASEAGSMGARAAQRLRTDGYTVVIAARREQQTAHLAAELGVDWLGCDITIEREVETLAHKIVARHGRLDCAINMAGQAVMGDIGTTTEDNLRRAVDVHLIGPFFFFKHMAAVMHDGGAMITTSSLTASRVINNHAAYVAAKAGADHLMRIAAVEYGGRGIRVNAVAPGFTGDTPMSRDFVKLEGLVELFESRIPLARLNTAEDVAHVVAWLCDPATFVSGEVIQVNGGNALTGLPAKRDFSALVKAHKS